MAHPAPIDPTFATAFEAAEFLLDVTGEAQRSGDFEAYAMRFALPNVVVSPQGSQTLGTRADLRRVFDGVRTVMADKGDAEMVRSVISAQFIGTTELLANHISCWMVDGVRIAAPYTCSGTAQLIHGRWQIVRSSYLVKTIPHLAAVLAGTPKRTS